jgi:cytochrome bd-type quinol oxidase subunit 2
MLAGVFIATVTGLNVVALALFLQGWRASESETVRIAMVRVRPIVGLIALAGLVVAFVGAWLALNADGPPDQQARLVAQGISEAMNCGAFSLLAALPVIVETILLKRRHTRLCGAAQT